LLQRKQFGYTPLLKDEKGNFIKDKKTTLWASWVWLWTAIWTRKDLDEIDSGFFNQSWELDKTDLDFFNNL
jgi:hypothetical protein